MENLINIVERAFENAEQKRDRERETIALINILVTYGYRACERGENITKVLSDAVNTWTSKL